MVVAMFWRKPVICLVLAVVTTLHLDRGKASDSQAAVQRPAVPGTGRLGSVKREAGSRIRHGSLWFRHDEHGANTPSCGKMNPIKYNNASMHTFILCKKKKVFVIYICCKLYMLVLIIIETIIALSCMCVCAAMQ